jgi:cell division protein FtsZ
MPRIDELPIPAQNELRAKRGELRDDHPERQRMTLLQRLANVGLGRKEDRSDSESARSVPRPQVLDRAPPRPAPRPSESASAEPVSAYAKRPAPQGLDQHGRQAPVHNAPEDDQLDIPAFLRRQAN